ncbi:MAG: hypothetical protein VYD68_00525, partial [Pseudomonadota bacterium]|nr:hypothetical protein [Pseudomonadota bacterium]
ALSGTLIRNSSRAIKVCLFIEDDLSDQTVAQVQAGFLRGSETDTSSPEKRDTNCKAVIA